eukprot:TRINITY_DN1039_c1_g1_i13.p1 TRINITY_DN1039_c1_g1~~TRINITY_DN1039_c1_g1_i13.p1  ORF type:complete len:827 (-),score=217.71 TRINITY_DN1039_c1_g1_i13:239-2719(-)
MFTERDLNDSASGDKVGKKAKKRKSNSFSVVDEPKKVLDESVTPKKPKTAKSDKKSGSKKDKSPKVPKIDPTDQKSPKDPTSPKPASDKKKAGKKEKKSVLDLEKDSTEVKEEFDFMNLLLPNSKSEFTEEGDREFDEDFEGENEKEGNTQDFIDAMASLDGKKKKILTTRGSSSTFADANNSASNENRVELEDLLKTLDKSTRKLSKRAENNKKAETLTAPLHRQAEEKITRAAGYSRVREEVNVWDGVVHRNRTEETVHYPLERPDLRIQTADQVVKTRFAPETPLELQVAALLAGSSANPQPGEELSEMEKKALEGLTPKEIAERRSELAKFRALASYQAAKYRRQNKIKSKSYRKLVRKIKNKQKLKELENLAETDPEAAAAQIEMLNKRRIEERATLKHRNASRYMQDQAKRAKLTKNKDLQNVLHEQLAQHRELTTKPKVVSESEDSESDSDTEDINVSNLPLENKNESYAEFSASYRKFWEADQKAKISTQNELKAENVASARDQIEDLFDDAEHAKRQTEMFAQLKKEKKAAKKAEKKRKQAEREEGNSSESENDKEENDAVLEHAESLETNTNTKSTNSISNNKKSASSELEKSANSESEKSTSVQQKKKPANEIDPESFITSTKKLKSDLPEICGYNDEDDSDAENSDSSEHQRQMIAEAFADDDVMEDFRKEKAEILAASKPKDIDLTLPGWGEWGGGGLVPSKKKRKRFTIKAPPEEKPRKDLNKGHLIVNADKDSKLREHQVSNLPSLFNSVSDFEASIRAPIGDTFQPRTAFLKMVAPKVVTKLGHTIEPMDKTALLNQNKQVVEELLIHKS